MNEIVTLETPVCGCNSKVSCMKSLHNRDLCVVVTERSRVCNRFTEVLGVVDTAEFDVFNRYTTALCVVHTRGFRVCKCITEVLGVVDTTKSRVCTCYTRAL